MINCVISC